jgi:hypothetical protein
MSLVTPGDPGHRPGAADVSHTRQGIAFKATPNFYHFPDCGRPCWLRLYPAPRFIPGAEVTDHFPYERYGRQPGQALLVVCQVQGMEVFNKAGQRSRIWNMVVVPASKVVSGERGLRVAPKGQGYYAYGPDLIMGNTGWRDIPCRV